MGKFIVSTLMENEGLGTSKRYALGPLKVPQFLIISVIGGSFSEIAEEIVELVNNHNIPAAVSYAEKRLRVNPSKRHRCGGEFDPKIKIDKLALELNIAVIERDNKHERQMPARVKQMREDYRIARARRHSNQ